MKGGRACSELYLLNIREVSPKRLGLKAQGGKIKKRGNRWDGLGRTLLVNGEVGYSLGVYFQVLRCRTIWVRAESGLSESDVLSRKG